MFVNFIDSGSRCGCSGGCERFCCGCGLAQAPASPVGSMMAELFAVIFVCTIKKIVHLFLYCKVMGASLPLELYMKVYNDSCSSLVPI